MKFRHYIFLLTLLISSCSSVSALQPSTTGAIFTDPQNPELNIIFPHKIVYLNSVNRKQGSNSVLMHMLNTGDESKNIYVGKVKPLIESGTVNISDLQPLLNAVYYEDLGHGVISIKHLKLKDNDYISIWVVKKIGKNAVVNNIGEKTERYSSDEQWKNSNRKTIEKYVVYAKNLYVQFP